MARITDYSSLQTAVSEWLGRTGDTALSARADAFIDLFESEFIGDPEMRTFEMEETDTATIPAAAFALPDGFLEMERLQTIDADGNPIQKLEYVSPDNAAVLDATTSATGTAKNYTIIGGQIVITPQKWAPVGTTIELIYYKFTKLADAAGGTNWLVQKYPNIYLYGSLMQAAAYIDDKETVQFWDAGRSRAIANLAKSDRKRKIGSGPLAVRPSAAFRR